MVARLILYVGVYYNIAIVIVCMYIYIIIVM